MKNIKILILLLVALSYAACKKCEEVKLEPCGDHTPNSEHCNWTVATCYAEDGPVGVIYDTRANGSAPKGDDWGATVPSIHPANWTTNRIGQVFGIAIDAQENIYLGASDIYHFGSGAGLLGAPNSIPAQIYKCVAPSWNAVPFVALPNSGGLVNGTGNIAYDRKNEQLFASNLEDGKIYRIGMDGSILDTYDPWTADNATAGIVVQDERVWGIGVNTEEEDVKIYFARISSQARELFSVTLKDDGSFPVAASEALEIQDIPGTQLIIADIAFSADSKEMLIAERNHPHQSVVISYSKTGSAWGFNLQYFVGGNAGSSGRNSAGGVDFAYAEKSQDTGCDEFFWVSGNFMDARNSSLSKIYGIEGIAYSGNNASTAPTPTANQDTDLFIDFDGVGGTSPKRTIGDVEVFDCTECIPPCELNDFVK